jgi:hypothetical protein
MNTDLPVAFYVAHSPPSSFTSLCDLITQTSRTTRSAMAKGSASRS